MSIQVTASARQQIIDQLKKRGAGEGIRIAIKTAGCSGLAYKMEFVDAPKNEDHIFEQEGVKVFIDPKSLIYISGTEVDFIQEGLNEGFVFRNPNTTAECGCGESFFVN